MGRRVEWLILAVILLVAALMRLRGISNPLLDDQAWRQADTAGMAIHMLGKLTHIPAVFFPRLSYDGSAPQPAELEFPFLPYLLAATWRLAGRADEYARLWAVLFSLAAVGGVYDLGRRLRSAQVGLTAAAVYAFYPLTVYYGRTPMPEPVAQAFSVWALSLICRWRQEGGRVFWPGLLMSLAILAKLPQLMLLPVALVLGFWPAEIPQTSQTGRIGQAGATRRCPPNFRRLVPSRVSFRPEVPRVYTALLWLWRPALVYLAAALIPSLAYYLWVHLGTPALGRFTSGILTHQVYGGVARWRILRGNLLFGLSRGGFALALGGALGLVLSRLGLVPALWSAQAAAPPPGTQSGQRAGMPVSTAMIVWLGVSLVYILVVCARISLDYYLVPVLLPAALLSAWALSAVPDVPGRVLAFTAICLLALNSYAVLTPKYAWDAKTLLQGEWLRSHTPAGAILVLSDPEPMTFYYAQRSGFRLLSPDDAQALADLPGLKADYLVRLPRTRRQEVFWQAVAAAYPEVGPGVYRLP